MRLLRVGERPYRGYRGRMTTHVWRRPPLAAASCVGVLVAAVVGVWAGWWAAEPGRRVSQSSPLSSVVAQPAWRAGSVGDVGGGDSRPEALPQLTREVVRGVVPTGAAAGGPLTWQLLLPCLAMGALVVVGPRALHPRGGAHRHGTRAPPAWS